jgi:hypothetical protein
MSGLLPIRVTVLDTWDEVALDLPDDTPVSEVKQRALTASHVPHPPSGYLVKYLGAELSAEGATLASAGVVPNGALIVMSRRRIPAR